MIHIPDFSSLPDEELHGWEFEVYDKTPDVEGDLVEVVGSDVARRYYEERGKRVDLQGKIELQTRILADLDSLLEIEKRLKDNTSGKHWYGI